MNYSKTKWNTNKDPIVWALHWNKKTTRSLEAVIQLYEINLLQLVASFKLDRSQSMKHFLNAVFHQLATFERQNCCSNGSNIKLCRHFIEMQLKRQTACFGENTVNILLLFPLHFWQFYIAYLSNFARFIVWLIFHWLSTFDDQKFWTLNEP